MLLLLMLLPLLARKVTTTREQLLSGCLSFSAARDTEFVFICMIAPKQKAKYFDSPHFEEEASAGMRAREGGGIKGFGEA